jgi:hypothetical protein
MTYQTGEQAPRSNAADCHNRNSSLANRSQVDCGLPSSALMLPGIHASGQSCGNQLSNSHFCLWQSARRLFYSSQSAVQTPRIATIPDAPLSAECGIRLKSSQRHFTSRIPLFEVSYIFAARLLAYKLPTRRIVEA